MLIWFLSFHGIYHVDIIVRWYCCGTNNDVCAIILNWMNECIDAQINWFAYFDFVNFCLKQFGRVLMQKALSILSRYKFFDNFHIISQWLNAPLTDYHLVSKMVQNSIHPKTKKKDRRKTPFSFLFSPCYFRYYSACIQSDKLPVFCWIFDIFNIYHTQNSLRECMKRTRLWNDNYYKSVTICRVWH